MEDPSAWLCMNVFLSSVGFGVFIYGRRQRKGFPFLIGALLLGFPYLVSSLLWMSIIGASLLFALWFLPRVGLDF